MPQDPWTARIDGGRGQPAAHGVEVVLGHAERQRAVAAAAADGRHQVKLAAHPVPHGGARLRVGDPIIDDFIVFPGFPGLPERVPDVAALPRFLTVRMRRFDLAIQLHGSGALSNSIVGLLGARRQAGFHEAGSWSPDLVTCLPWGEPEHEVTRYLRLMQRLGCSGGDAALEFSFEAADRAAMAALEPLPPAVRYVCIQAGARMRTRRWPAARLGQVADGLAARLDGCADRQPGGARRCRRGDGAHGGGGARPDWPTTLGALALALVVSRAALVVSNDTAMSHIAAAGGTPSVIVSSGADPVRWAPLDQARHRVLFASVACRPCAYEACPIGHPCALDVRAERVLEAALNFCEGGAFHAPSVRP